MYEHLQLSGFINECKTTKVVNVSNRQNKTERRPHFRVIWMSENEEKNQKTQEPTGSDLSYFLMEISHLVNSIYFFF